MSYIAATYICQIFTEFCGKWQDRKEISDKKAMFIDFSRNIDYDNEEGYRHFHILIYAPANYVQVWVKETWDVGKKGKKWEKGESKWQLICDHDSEWRSTIQSFMHRYRDEISTAPTPWKFVGMDKVPAMTKDAREGSIKL